MRLQVLCVVLLLTFFDRGSSYVVRHNVTDTKARIIGNDFVAENQAPYHVIVTCGGMTLCGGALVSDRHVVTAAHCIDKCDLLIVFAGTHDRKQMKNYRLVKTSYAPAKYSKSIYSTGEHDISVLELSRPFPISKTIAPIKLPSRPPRHNEKFSLTGFGRVSRRDEDSTSEELKIYHSRVMDSAHCNYKLPERVLDYSDFCDTPVPSEGACLGDSGGPAVNENGELIGVVSRQLQSGDTSKACLENVPTIYTSVYAHRNFISEAINKGSEKRGNSEWWKIFASDPFQEYV